jgi:hypothetical protein
MQKKDLEPWQTSCEERGGIGEDREIRRGSGLKGVSCARRSPTTWPSSGGGGHVQEAELGGGHDEEDG